ncbi:MAG: c-type cytochrome [Solirubrobacterales bacterium]|jgi:mono/diheme cytochrome c family protein
MRKAVFLASVALVMLSICGCSGGRKGSAGFHIPDGDAANGKAVFVAMRCHACHRVADLDLEAPVAQPPVPVVLGGRVGHAPTDGELVTAIVDPSHKLAHGYPPPVVRAGNRSRMGEFGDAMTVRELVDLVAFLQSRYEVMPPPLPMN